MKKLKFNRQKVTQKAVGAHLRLSHTDVFLRVAMTSTDPGLVQQRLGAKAVSKLGVITGHQRTEHLLFTCFELVVVPTLALSEVGGIVPLYCRALGTEG
jgi:hypothetical protein